MSTDDYPILARMDQPRYSQRAYLEPRTTISVPLPLRPSTELAQSASFKSQNEEQVGSMPRSQSERIELPPIRTLLQNPPESQSRNNLTVSPGASALPTKLSISPSQKRRRLSDDEGYESHSFGIYDSPVRSPRLQTSILPRRPFPAIRSPSADFGTDAEHVGTVPRPSLPRLSSWSVENPLDNGQREVSTTASKWPNTTLISTISPSEVAAQGYSKQRMNSSKPPTEATFNSPRLSLARNLSLPDSNRAPSAPYHGRQSISGPSGPSNTGWPSDSQGSGLTRAVLQQSPFSVQAVPTVSPHEEYRDRQDRLESYYAGYSQPEGDRSAYNSPGKQYSYQSNDYGSSAYVYGYGGQTPYGLGGMAGISIGKQRKRRGNLPKETTEKLRSWFVAHLPRPYPTEEQKQELMRATGLQMNQISNWFINARRRQMPTLMKSAKGEPSARSTESSQHYLPETGCSAPTSTLGSEDESEVDEAESARRASVDHISSRVSDRAAYDSHDTAGL